MKKTLIALLFAVAATVNFAIARNATVNFAIARNAATHFAKICNAAEVVDNNQLLSMAVQATPAPNADILPFDKDEFQNAIRYIISDNNFRYWSMILYGNNRFIPSHLIFLDEQENDNSNPKNVIIEVPIEDRTIDREYRQDVVGMDTAVNLMEYLSAKRMSLDFEELYKQYRPIIRLAVSKEDYQEQFQQYVEALLVTYDDISTNQELRDMMQAVMEAHLSETHENPGNAALPYLYYKIESLVSPKVKQFIDDYSGENFDDYEDIYPVMWAYSFWLRRDNEGKTQEVLNALKAVQKDYK